MRLARSSPTFVKLKMRLSPPTIRQAASSRLKSQNRRQFLPGLGRGILVESGPSPVTRQEKKPAAGHKSGIRDGSIVNPGEPR